MAGGGYVSCNSGYVSADKGVDSSSWAHGVDGVLYTGSTWDDTGSSVGSELVGGEHIEFGGA